MKFIKQYIEEKYSLQTKGRVTLKHVYDDAGLDGVKVCINNVETGLFISQAEYDEWVESMFDEMIESKNNEKLTNKITPRFKVGNWVVYNNANVYQVKKIDYTGAIPRYELENIDVDKLSIPFTSDYNLRNWNIQDAKDGDVLASNNGNIILVKESRDSSWGYRLSYHCAVLHDGTFEPREFHVNPKKLFPATKEQRELLFAKIKEYGYEWDSDNKKLNEIEQKSLERSEDERIRKELIAYLDVQDAITDRKDQDFKHWITWLEKQDRQMVARGERKNLALSLMDYLDNNRVEGCMDLSSMECEDLENAVVNSDWGKVYRYMRKKLEKQDK